MTYNQLLKHFSNKSTNTPLDGYFLIIWLNGPFFMLSCSKTLLAGNTGSTGNPRLHCQLKTRNGDARWAQIVFAIRLEFICYYNLFALQAENKKWRGKVSANSFLLLGKNLFATRNLKAFLWTPTMCNFETNFNLQKQSLRGVLRKRCSWKFRKIHRKILVLEYLYIWRLY